MPQLGTALLCLAATGLTGIWLMIYRWCLPRTLGRPDDPKPHARCRTCRQQIRGCRHVDGVGSLWVHAATGDKYGPDGHMADHR
jgi:hypothetical protein